MVNKGLEGLDLDSSGMVIYPTSSFLLPRRLLEGRHRGWSTLWILVSSPACIDKHVYEDSPQAPWMSCKCFPRREAETGRSGQLCTVVWWGSGQWDGKSERTQAQLALTSCLHAYVSQIQGDRLTWDQWQDQ